MKSSGRSERRRNPKTNNDRSDIKVCMAKEVNKNSKTQGLNISDKQIEILARRLLPQIKKFFANEDIQKEFEEWQKKQHEEKTE